MAKPDVASRAAVSRPVLFSALLATTMLTVPALAQESGIETVTVTAEKRTEDVQKVPMNVQAITGQSLSDLHLTDFTEFEKYMPSVTYAVSGQGSNGGPGFSNITMRGVATDQNGNHSGPLPTVGVYIDEQPITTINGTLDIPTYDVARVEALSGPQGTLYGASAESGVIRIITNKPDPSGFSANYAVNINSVAHGGIGGGGNGMVNLPLGEHAAIRLVAWDEHDAGYIDNVHVTRTYPTSGITIDNANRVKKNYNTVDKMGARAELGIDLNDNWTITPSLMGQSERVDGVFGYDSRLLSPAAAAAQPVGLYPSAPTFDTVSKYGALEVGHWLPDYSKDNWYQAALTVQGKIADLDVTYSGAYMNRIVKAEADYSDYAFWYDKLDGYGAYFYDNAYNLVDPTQYIVGKDAFTKESHELRISNDQSNRFRFVVGAFMERQSHHILQDYKVAGDLIDMFRVPGWGDTIWLTDELRVDRDYALFGEATYDILPNLSVTGGIRVFRANNSLDGFFGFSKYFSPDHYDMNGNFLYHGTGVAGCFTGPIVNGSPCTNLNADVKDSGETHKLNVTWHVDEDKMLYATYSTGFRPGGVNRRNDIPGVGPYSPDKLINYEVGWKTQWDDNRVRFNGDFYYENWQDFQFSFLGPNSVTIIANAGNAHIKGVESSLEWLPVDSLTLTANAAYTEANLATNYCGGLCSDPSNSIEAPAGTQLPITPLWKVNAIARYDFTVDGFLAHVQGALVHQSGFWSDLRAFNPNLPGGEGERQLLGKNQASTLVDFTAGFGKDNWTIDLSVQNVFDQLAQLGRYPACTPGTCGYEPYVLPAQPRTVGLTFSQKFD